MTISGSQENTMTTIDNEDDNNCEKYVHALDAYIVSCRRIILTHFKDRVSVPYSLYNSVCQGSQRTRHQ